MNDLCYPGFFKFRQKDGDDDGKRERQPYVMGHIIIPNK
jgi:hypothetical protein